MSKDRPQKQEDLNEIDENLRRAYKDLLNEPPPDRFATLLDQLRKGEITKAQQDDEENGA